MTSTEVLEPLNTQIAGILGADLARTRFGEAYAVDLAIVSCAQIMLCERFETPSRTDVYRPNSNR